MVMRDQEPTRGTQRNPMGLGPVPHARAVPLLVLDLDGTVRHGLDELGRFVNGPDDVVVFPEAVAQMRAWKKRGGRIIAVSNQGGIALGHLDFETCAAAMMKTHELTGRLFDKIAWCRHHPNAIDPEYARCWCRKPSPGLLIEAALDLAHATGEMYPPYLGLFVGDRPEDEQCAKLAGFDFQWAADWRKAEGTQP
jgi:D-glycero-D-manno-heptose 1,7-bisphosphate phosphatase